jgi:dephospho-CoA kinase
MHVVFLAGGIASGKSTVLRELKRRGACCADLDAISREVTQAGSPTNELLADAFGADILDDSGALRRAELARRAFATSEGTRKLEQIVHPAIREHLGQWLAAQRPDAICVVEIPLLDRVEDLIPLADEVLCVVSSMDTRRVRAVGRGMTVADFDARVANQPSDEWLRAHADTILENDGTAEELSSLVRCWWASREAAGWPA